ncbi:unnamed protein product [marine sediment metagenome]|uniref:Uncharacterized protein n=1 Tax=marine sediment metagenome TaxID=412755 RepID=X1R0U6_9ZZZZ
MPEPDTIDYKGQVVGKVLGCEIRVVTTADGKKHFESDCLSKKARDDLMAVFEEEAVLRVTPKAFLEEIAEPEPAPDPRLNPTES